MSRFFKKITLDEFKEKINPILNPEDEDTDGFPYNMPESISKDLKKVSFDFENYEIGNAWKNFNPDYEREKTDRDYPYGYEVLGNGMPCLFVQAGGDWEFPICFTVYFDGSKLRGYIPSDGNLWNRKAKSAFGNEEYDTDKKELYEMYKKLISEGVEWTPIETINELYAKLENVKEDESLYDFYNSLDALCSRKAILNDVMNRIKEKL